MKEFFAICDYFGITPQQFFEDSLDNPKELSDIIALLKNFKEEDLKLFIELLKRMKK